MAVRVLGTYEMANTGESFVEPFTQADGRKVFRAVFCGRHYDGTNIVFVPMSDWTFDLGEACDAARLSASLS